MTGIDLSTGTQITVYGIRYRAQGDGYDLVQTIGRSDGWGTPVDKIFDSAATFRRRGRIHYAYPVHRVEVVWTDPSLAQNAWPVYKGPWTPLACCDMHNHHCEPPAGLCCQHCSEATHPTHGDRTPCILTTPAYTEVAR